MSLGNLLRWLASYKRPLFACVAVCVTLGSVALYAYFIRTLPPLPRAENLLEVAKGKFDIEITLTFDAEADKAFLLEPTSVEVSLEGEPILQETQNFRAGHPVVAENVPGVKVGDNDFHVAVYSGDAARNLTNAADSESDAFSLGFDQPSDEEDYAVARAVRVRILRDGLPIAEQTLWSDPGKPVEGQVLVTVPTKEAHGHTYDH